MKTRLLSCIALLAIAVPAASQESRRAITIDDYFALNSVSESQISPDGQWIAYTVTTKDLKKDESETRIWMVPAAGGEAIPMTAKGYSAGSPRFSPDGKYLSFMAKRSESGEDKTDSEDRPQVWALNRLGGEAQQLTSVKQGVSGYEWSPDGGRLVLTIRDPKPYELTEDPKDDKKPRPYVVDRLQFKRPWPSSPTAPRARHRHGAVTCDHEAQGQVLVPDHDQGHCLAAAVGGRVLATGAALDLVDA